MRIYNTEKLHIKSWCESPETGAIEQAKNLANLPFAFKHIALMPDTHQGYGMPIGGVLATQDVIVPNAVGVDIGCGMCATKFNLLASDLDTKQIKGIVDSIKARIPVGFKHHNQPQKWSGFDDVPNVDIVEKELDSASYQLGTLGGGNHFIEIQKGSDGYIWAMIHSGSRNFGYQIAKEYNRIAQENCRMWHSNIPKFSGEDGLAFLPNGSEYFNEYLLSMNYALAFAKASREHMSIQVWSAFNEILDTVALEYYDVHHNYASLENHFGKNVYVHRKGATSAKLNEIGIIPGSQGTCSYLVKGKGNHDSFMSCSHGAGRKMSRKKARSELNLAEEIKRMDNSNIIHGIVSVDDLDESAGAYKDINVVMKEQEDLVSILVELKPLAVVKG